VARKDPKITINPISSTSFVAYRRFSVLNRSIPAPTFADETGLIRQRSLRLNAGLPLGGEVSRGIDFFQSHRDSSSVSLIRVLPH